jgi:hypothetical protein
MAEGLLFHLLAPSTPIGIYVDQNLFGVFFVELYCFFKAVPVYIRILLTQSA